MVGVVVVVVAEQCGSDLPALMHPIALQVLEAVICLLLLLSVLLMIGYRHLLSFRYDDYFDFDADFGAKVEVALPPAPFLHFSLARHECEYMQMMILLG